MCRSSQKDIMVINPETKENMKYSIVLQYIYPAVQQNYRSFLEGKNLLLPNEGVVELSFLTGSIQRLNLYPAHFRIYW